MKKILFFAIIAFGFSASSFSQCEDFPATTWTTHYFYNYDGEFNLVNGPVAHTSNFKMIRCLLTSNTQATIGSYTGVKSYNTGAGTTTYQIVPNADNILAWGGMVTAYVIEGTHRDGSKKYDVYVEMDRDKNGEVDSIRRFTTYKD